VFSNANENKAARLSPVPTGNLDVKVDKSSGLFRRALQYTLSIFQVKIDKSAGPFLRALQYVLHDWTEDMSWPRRLLTMAGLMIQLCALSLALVEPKRVPLMFLAVLIYIVGLFLMNGMVTSEFVRKTQLEADQLAAQQIQRTLHPQMVEEVAGYQVEMFYQAIRGVGGDYFDVIELPNGQTLFAVADVSGKGMPAALLAANIQALVRSISNVTSDPLFFAAQVNKHLCHYTPPDHFATAVFALLFPETGELTYVNAGHNLPILSSEGRATFLESTGMPLGLVREAEFECQRTVIPPGGKLLLFTDGLPDGIGGQTPEVRICDILERDVDAKETMLALQALIDPKFNEDDVTMLLLRRLASTTSARLNSH